MTTNRVSAALAIHVRAWRLRIFGPVLFALSCLWPEVGRTTTVSLKERLAHAAPDRVAAVIEIPASDRDRALPAVSLIEIDIEDAERAHAVILASFSNSRRNPPAILVDGSRVSTHPVPTAWGSWYLLPAGTFTPGSNRIAFDPAEEAGGGEIGVLPLLDEVEIDHFGTLARFVAADAEPPVDPRQLAMDVIHCDLSIRIDPLLAEIPQGAVTVTFAALDDGLRTLVLDFDDNDGLMQILSAETVPGGTPLPFVHDGDADRVIVDLPYALSAGGMYQVRVRFAGVPGTGYYADSHRGGPLVYTYSQPYAARGWWPCKDIPSDKFLADTRLTVPEGKYNGYALTPVSNGTLLEIEEPGDGTRTFHWREEYPIASYLVSIACSNYRPAAGTYTALDGVTSMDVVHYLYPENYARSSGEVVNTIAIIGFLARTFGEYPFLEEKYATADWGLATAMEHQTCTTISETYLSTPFHRLNTHELSHMWFGDLITYRSYTHLWIAEGWARYSEALMDEARLGTGAYHARVDSWAVSDGRPLVSPEQYRFDTLTFRTAYNKGGWVLHMLRHQLGEDTFFGGARAFVANPDLRYGVAETEDLCAAFESGAGEDLAWYFEQWAMRSDRPRFQWRWRNRIEDDRSLVDLFLRQTQPGDVYRAPVDFEILPADGSRREFTVNVASRIEAFTADIGDAGVSAADVRFDPGHWLLAYNTRIAPVGAPTGAPVLLAVTAGENPGAVRIAWEEADSLTITGYRLYESADGEAEWSLVLDDADLPVTAAETLLEGIDPAQPRFYRLTSVNDGLEGPASDVYGVCAGADGASRCLIVDAWDAWEIEARTETGHGGAAACGRAVAAAGRAFDTCADEAVGGLVPLVPSRIIVWLAGTDLYGFETVSPQQQTLLRGYLEAGGRLLVSGDDLLRDLGQTGLGTAEDQAFLRDALHCAFVAEQAAEGSVQGAGGSSAFGVETFALDAAKPGGGMRTPDRLAPVNANRSLVYPDGGEAGVQHAAPSGAERPHGAAITLGFDLLSIASEEDRRRAVGLALDWLEAPTAPIVDGFSLD